MTVITLSDLSAEIEWKAIKNVHLTIYPPMREYMFLPRLP